MHCLNVMSEQEAILGDGVNVQKIPILMLQSNSFEIIHTSTEETSDFESV